MENFEEHIDRCFGLIEQKLEKGPRKEWNTDDFKVLGKHIQEKTGTLLSISTLKRLSGKVNYDSKPNISTLNALAEYLDFKDWRTFRSCIGPLKLIVGADSNKKGWAKYIIAAILLILAVSIVVFYNQGEKVYDPDDFVFKSRPVSEGIPNSVVFEYDATAAEKNSKIEIQQYWDETKRMTIDKSDSIATSIYYHPGFFKSKLVVDDTILKEDDVFITTKDWLGIIEQDPRPIYIDNSEIFKEDRISITPETVSSYDLDPRTSNVVVSLYQVKDFGELYTDNFELNTTLKNDFKEAMSACQPAQVLILYDGGAIGIPMAKKGCASEITLMTFDGFVNGKKNDLSNFGVNFEEFVDLKCVSKNQNLDIFLNGTLAYQMNVPKPAFKIKGIVIKFEGAGSVKNVEFKKSNEIVYTSNF